MSKLLFIDDEEGVRKVFSILLKEEGYEVITAENGEKGLEVFRQENPPIALVDIKMPGMDGIEVLKKIKEINPETEVIIITGHGDMKSAIEALKLDASDFLTKPVSDEALSIALKRAQEKIKLKQQLKEYTYDLENMVRAATKEIKRRYEFEKKLIHSSMDGIVATDEKGDIIIFNQGAERIFGYPRFEVVRKKNIADVYPPWMAKEIIEGLSKGGKHFSWKETSIFTKDGKEIPVRFFGAILYESGEILGSVCFFHDLREIKKLEQELVNSERLAAIGQTVSSIAHYTKNILSGLKGGIYVVDAAFKEGNMARFKTGWEMIQRNVGRISNLVMDLLNYSKEREPQYQDCFPNDIAYEVCELMEQKAKEHGIQIVKDFDSSIGKVALDPQGIHNVLLNLVSNAIDACIFDTDEKKKWWVKVKTALDEEAIIFEVSDNGCGMDEEVKRRIFTSFFSTKGGKGTGLGLLVTQKIVKEHGGIIEVRSKQGQGSTFIVRIPKK